MMRGDLALAVMGMGNVLDMDGDSGLSSSKKKLRRTLRDEDEDIDIDAVAEKASDEAEERESDRVDTGDKSKETPGPDGVITPQRAGPPAAHHIDETDGSDSDAVADTDANANANSDTSHDASSGSGERVTPSPPPADTHPQSQLDMMPVLRIDLKDASAATDLRNARLSGVPTVLVGMEGWASFAEKWVRPKVATTTDGHGAACVAGSESTVGGGTTANPDFVRKQVGDVDEDEPVIISSATAFPAPGDETSLGSSSLGGKARSKTHEAESEKAGAELEDELELDVEALVADIGDELVPVVKRDYDVTHPIHTHISVRDFVREGWCNQDVTTAGGANRSKLYMHQWQFPLSDSAAAKLCHRSRPITALGDDLTAYWLDRCRGDSPFQYIFLGYKDTYTKLHRDNGYAKH